MESYLPKPKFIERLHELLRDDKDVDNFLRIAGIKPKKSIRVNTLKIGVNELVNRLKEKGWKINQPFNEHKEIIVIENELEPGELGKTREHLLGYYYVQEITSMMPVIAIDVKEENNFLDLCASPGSKTTYAAAIMKNKGSIIANDVSIGRISILNANLERCGVMNTIVTRHPGNELIERFKKLKIKFDKILIDAPCSGEGNIRCNPRIYREWSEGLLKSLSRKQKRIVNGVYDILGDKGEIIYSTCTYAPEENELIVQYLLDNFNLEIAEIKLPLKIREGLLEWRGKSFDKSMKKAVRIYHHDNDMEGFFLCKLRKK